jgi:hypothetical protein
MIEVLLLTQVAATFVMVGVIWFVQIVHYPLGPVESHVRHRSRNLEQIRAVLNPQGIGQRIFFRASKYVGR